MMFRPNGCELSGRGSFPNEVIEKPGSPLSLDSAAASPVRLSPFFGGSSELLGCCSMQPTSNQAHDLSIQSLKIGRAEIMKDGGELPFRGSSLTLCAPIAQHGAFN